MTKLCFTLIQNNLYCLSKVHHISPMCIDDYHVFKSHSKERKNWEWYWRHIDKCQVAEFMNVIILPLIMNFCRSHFFFKVSQNISGHIAAYQSNVHIWMLSQPSAWWPIKPHGVFTRRRHKWHNDSQRLDMATPENHCIDYFFSHICMKEID